MSDEKGSYLCTTMLTIQFDAGVILPKQGDKIDLGDFVAHVTMVNVDTRKVTIVVPSSGQPINSLVDKYKESLRESEKEVASILYEEFSSGMTSLVGWDKLPDKERLKYISVSDKIFDILRKKELIRFDYKG